MAKTQKHLPNRQSRVVWTSVGTEGQPIALTDLFVVAREEFAPRHVSKPFRKERSNAEKERTQGSARRLVTVSAKVVTWPISPSAVSQILFATS